MSGSRNTYNPILPLDEYIPDGEPHVFGDRLYLFGSHDTEGGKRYCAEENYVGWSAPLDDPSDWRYEGVIYEATQDPDYEAGVNTDLYAPDVVQGNDGRFYMYYTLSEGHSKAKVAVCDTPCGKYEYLGFVRNPDGTPHCMYSMADPAVINDDGVIRLYAGWSLSMVAAAAHSQGAGQERENHELKKAGQETVAGQCRSQGQGQEPQGQGQETQGPGQEAKGPSGQAGASMLPKWNDPDLNMKMAPVLKMLFHRDEESLRKLKHPLMGANALELMDDMLTVKGEPKRIVEGQFSTDPNGSFFGHAFYEASSIRKINGLYYFIYSSENSNELCYATSKYPDRDFVYGGAIISNGDVGYRGLKPEDRNNMTANDHGSLVCVGGQWYIFHHRQTHRNTFSRQACVERVEIEPDGHIAQVECTSLGFSEALRPEGTVPAPVSCVLTNGHMPHCTNTALSDDIPYITHGEGERYITGIKDGVLIGYKYFEFTGETSLKVTVRGGGTGKFVLLAGEKDEEPSKVGEIAIRPSAGWETFGTKFHVMGRKSLFFRYEGEGEAEFLEFSFEG